MKRLLFCFIVVLLTGCGSTSPSSPVVESPNKKDVRGDVPLDVVLGIPARIPTLKPGMTPAAVLQALGLDGYRVLTLTSGPDQRIGHQLLLRPEYFLFLYYDESHQPPSFIDATFLHDEGPAMKKAPNSPDGAAHR